MCVKTIYLISILLFLCFFFMHACNAARPFALTNNLINYNISHKKSHLPDHNKIEEKLKFHKCIGSCNTSAVMDPYYCKKNKGIKGIKSGNSSADCKPSLYQASLQATKSKGSRWPHDDLNVREMASNSKEEEELSEMDYASVKRRPPIHNK